MKKISTLLLFVFLYTTGYTQVWKQLPNDGNRTNRSAAFAVNGTGYFFLGGYLTTVLSYDTTTHVWAPITPYPEGNTDGTVGCSLNGLGYAGMGVQYSNFSNSFYSYNPTSGTWKTLPNFPGTVRAYGVAFALDGKVYMGGGLSGGSVPNNDFYAYDPADSTWSPIAFCPARGVGCDPVSFVIGDKAYVGTGGEIESGQSVPQKDFWEYDTTSKIWSPIDSLPGSARAEASAFSTCDRGFVGLGYTNTPRSTDAQDFWQYNPSSGKWTQIANYGAGAENGASAVTIGNTGYVAGGLYVSSTVLYDLWSYAPSAIPAFSAVTSICSGQSVTFTDTSNYTPTRWSWQFAGGTPDTSTAQNPTIQYNTPGTYNVILTAWNSCDSGTKTFTNYITVGAGGTLIVKAIPSAQICSGQSVTLNVTTKGTNLVWTPATGLADTTGDTVVATPAASIKYSVSGMDSSGCVSTGTDSITVVTAPPLIVQPQSPKVCNGQGVTLYAPTSGSGYTWSSSAAITSSGDSATATPTVTTTYSVTGTDSVGCVATGTDSVYVITAPELIIQPQGPQSVCPGQSIALSVPVSGRDYNWLPSATLKPDTGDTVLAYPVVQTTYTVSGIDSLGCLATSDSEVVSVSNAPNKPTITVSGDVLTSSATQGNQWVRNDSILTGATGENYTATIPGWYQVIAENPANGCSTTSDSVDITSGINQLSVISGQLSIYPNPTGGEIFINISSSAGDIRDWYLQITDVLGRTVYTQLSLNYSNTIDLSNLASGVYFISVMNKAARAVVPVVRQ